MVQLIALGLVGGLVWYAYRSFKGHMSRIGDELDNNSKKKDEAKPGEPEKKPDRKANADLLELGEDGVYRPKKDD